MSNIEACSICEEYIEDVMCDKDKCPVGIMKKELDRFHKLQKPTETSGFRIENNKVVFYTNILNGYRHEYKDLDGVVKELNFMLQNCYKCDEVLSHYKGKLKNDKINAIKEFAERLKEKSWIGVWETVAHIDVDEIDNLVKEMTEGGGDI